MLFVDIVGSTARAAEVGDQRWAELLRSYRAVVRAELARYQGREIEAAGDAVLAIFDGTARAIRCARAITNGVRRLGIETRAGLHAGEVEVEGDRVSGIVVHIAARVMAQAKPGTVCVTSTVKDLVAGSAIVFDDWGVHTLKGVPGEWRLYAVPG